MHLFAQHFHRSGLKWRPGAGFAVPSATRSVAADAGCRGEAGAIAARRLTTITASHILDGISFDRLKY